MKIITDIQMHSHKIGNSLHIVLLTTCRDIRFVATSHMRETVSYSSPSYSGNVPDIHGTSNCTIEPVDLIKKGYSVNLGPEYTNSQTNIILLSDNAESEVVKEVKDNETNNM